MSEPQDPLYQRVLTLMLDGIRDGEWPPGSPVPSESQLIELTGASRSTVVWVTRLLRHYGFITGPGGGKTRVANPAALEYACTAWKAAETARELNRLT